MPPITRRDRQNAEALPFLRKPLETVLGSDVAATLSPDELDAMRAVHTRLAHMCGERDRKAPVTLAQLDTAFAWFEQRE